MVPVPTSRHIVLGKGRRDPIVLVLECDNLRHHFGEAREVMRGVSLSFESGSITAVMGPSGSGKTTVLNCMS